MQNYYSSWKNVWLFGLLIVALVYALPNLFGNDQAIQISSTTNTAVNSATVSDIKEVLAENKLKPLAVELKDDKVLARFSDADIQLKARDVIKHKLGDDYVIALNLAPRTPKWLLALGANPMKLGLDLRGGVHFLLEVDLNDMIKKREDGTLRSVIADLRDAGIRYSSVNHIQPHGIIIDFRDQTSLDKGYTELFKRLQDCSIDKISQDNEYKLKILMSEQAVFKIADYAIEQTINTLNKRVNELGIAEAIVQRQGSNHISIDLPGVQDTARAKELIGKTATLRFHMVDIDSERDMESALGGDVPIGSKLYKYNGQHILLKDQVILHGDAITYATPSFSQDGRPAVNVRLGGGGESSFYRATADNIGKPMAIVYVELKTSQQVVDGKPVSINHPIERVISVATIQSALGNNFEITGLQSEKYAQDLSLLLRSGALPASTNIVQEAIVGPSAGASNIHQGLVSMVVGYVFVMLFMVVYYRVFGIIANIALLLNLVFVSAILSILGATLTLPGIAGMVLTVGMAVDANVLIYERIREELRGGVSPQASIYAGYERAFTTIVDANVATLIVAIVLFALGSGAVKGFAVVLMIGLMTSMLTAIVFTRCIVNLIYGRSSVRKLSIGI